MNLSRKMLGAIVALATISQGFLLAATGDSITVKFLSGNPARIPNSPAHSDILCFSINGGELWQGSRIFKKDEPIANRIQVASSMCKFLYIKLGVCNPGRTSFAEVVSMIDRIKRIIVEKAQPTCRIEIIVVVPNRTIFEAPTPGTERGSPGPASSYNRDEGELNHKEVKMGSPITAAESRPSADFGDFGVRVIL